MSSIGLLKIVDPVLYYGKFIEGGVLRDGRKVDAFKTFTFKRGVTGGVSVGSAVVRQGGVSVVCSLYASLSPLSTQTPLSISFEGDDNIEQSVLAAVKSLLGDLVQREVFFDRESLLSSDSRLTWILDAKFKVLHEDGDLSSACVGALVAALTDVTLPTVLLSHAEDDDAPIEPANIRIQADETSLKPLKTTSLPVASTFMLYRGESNQHLLCDPPADVRMLCDAQFTVVIGSSPLQDSANPQILLMRTSGETTGELLDQMVLFATQRYHKVVQALKK